MNRVTHQARSRKRAFTAAATAVLLTAVLTGAGSHALFTARAAANQNRLSSGTVILGDNDLGGSTVTLTNAVPGASASGCVNIMFTGSVPSKVRLSATAGGGLASHLTLRITRGTIATPSFPSCTGFTPDATNYIGAGSGIIYDGALSAFPTTYAAGLVDPLAASPEIWDPNESHVYRVTMTLPAATAAAAQGLSATATLTWEARSP